MTVKYWKEIGGEGRKKAEGRKPCGCGRCGKGEKSCGCGRCGKGRNVVAVVGRKWEKYYGCGRCGNPV